MTFKCNHCRGLIVVHERFGKRRGIPILHVCAARLTVNPHDKHVGAYHTAVGRHAERNVPERGCG